jgi:hypothetical protein
MFLNLTCGFDGFLFCVVQKYIVMLFLSQDCWYETTNAAFPLSFQVHI